jgi:teichoic acid transport system ATP-binding protein
VAETTAAQHGPPLGAGTSSADLTVLARNLHIVYRVYEDRRTGLRDLIASRGRRPSYREVHAVRGVDLAAHRGEAIGLIGRNGSGKSTLMQAVAGLLPPAEGEVYASSQPSLLGVSAALNRTASGRRNIMLGGLALGMTRDEVEERMEEIIEWTGLEDFIDLPLRTYSSGMRARLLFAIATSVEPEILLVDEALNVGDEVFKERSKERIAALIAHAGTVFVVSHSMSTILEMCTRVIWLDRGQIAADGDPDEVITAYREHFKAERARRKAARKATRKKTPKKAKARRRRERRRARAAAAAEAAATAQEAADGTHEPTPAGARETSSSDRGRDEPPGQRE